MPRLLTGPEAFQSGSFTPRRTNSLAGESSHGRVAEMLRASEMAHSGHGLRLHPLSGGQPQPSKWALTGLDAF